MTMTREELLRAINEELGCDDGLPDVLPVSLLIEVRDYLQSSHEAELLELAKDVADADCFIDRSRDVPYCLSHRRLSPCVGERARELLKKIKGE